MHGRSEGLDFEYPFVDIDNDKALTWLRQGAQPTETVVKLLTISGAWEQFRAERPEKKPAAKASS